MANAGAAAVLAGKADSLLDYHSTQEQKRLREVRREHSDLSSKWVRLPELREVLVAFRCSMLPTVHRIPLAAADEGHRKSMTFTHTASPLRADTESTDEDCSVCSSHG